MRTVALFASHRSSEEFNKGWPMEDKEAVKKVWGVTKEDAQATREAVMKSHKIVLK